MVSFKSFLSAFGADFIHAFEWMGSSQGQATVVGIETAAVAVGTAINPAIGASIAGIEALINVAMKQILSMEASAAAVGAQSGTGAQKAAAVVASLAPQTGALLTTLGVSAPTAAQADALAVAINNGLTAILNAVPAPTVPTPAA